MPCGQVSRSAGNRRGRPERRFAGPARGYSRRTAGPRRRGFWHVYLWGDCARASRRLSCLLGSTMPSAGLRRRLCRARRCAECTRRAEAGVSTSGLPALAAVPSVARFEGGSRWLHAHTRAHDAFFVERCGMFIVGCAASMAWARHLVLGSGARARCAAASAGSTAPLPRAPLGRVGKAVNKNAPLTLPSHTRVPPMAHYNTSRSQI